MGDACTHMPMSTCILLAKMKTCKQKAEVPFTAPCSRKFQIVYSACVNHCAGKWGMYGSGCFWSSCWGNLDNALKLCALVRGYVVHSLLGQCCLFFFVVGLHSKTRWQQSVSFTQCHQIWCVWRAWLLSANARLGNEILEGNVYIFGKWSVPIWTMRRP